MKRRRVDLPAGRAFRRMALFLAVLIISGVAAVVWASEPPDAAVKNGGARAAGAASRGLPTRSSVQAGALRPTVARPGARDRKAFAMRAPSVRGEMPGRAAHPPRRSLRHSHGATGSASAQSPRRCQRAPYCILNNAPSSRLAYRS